MMQSWWPFAVTLPKGNADERRGWGKAEREGRETMRKKRRERKREDEEREWEEVREKERGRRGSGGKRE